MRDMLRFFGQELLNQVDMVPESIRVNAASVMPTVKGINEAPNSISYPQTQTSPAWQHHIANVACTKFQNWPHDDLGALSKLPFARCPIGCGVARMPLVRSFALLGCICLVVTLAFCFNVTTE